MQGREYQVDLECILKIEQKLWNILDVFAQSESKENVFEFWEEWWDLVDSKLLVNIHSIFADDLLRRSLRQASILEFLAITVINFLSSEWKNDNDLHGNLKVLIFYVHQNYLLLIKSILVKLPPYNGENIWVKTLKKTMKQ